LREAFSDHRPPQTVQLPADETRSADKIHMGLGTQPRTGEKDVFLWKPLEQAAIRDPQRLPLNSSGASTTVELGRAGGGYQRLRTLSDTEIDLEPVPTDHTAWWVQQIEVTDAPLRIERTLHRERPTLALGRKDRAAATPLEAEIEVGKPAVGGIGGGFGI